MLRILFGAALFGLTACLVFVWAKPCLEERIHPEPETTAEPIILPWEEETSAESVLPTEASGEIGEPEGSAAPEGTTASEPGETEGTGEVQTEESESAEGSGTETLSFEERVQGILDAQDFTLDDYKRLNGFLVTVIGQANHGIVMLTAEEDEGEKGNEGTEKRQIPGALFLMTESEGLILMDYSLAEECKTFAVRLYNGATGRGVLKAADRMTGIAVLSVSREFLDQAQILEMDTLPLGSSYTASLGQAVVLVGNPYGPVYSAAFGRLVYLASAKAGIDNERRMLYVDIPAAVGGGFLVNLDGEILGLTTENTREGTEAGYRNLLAVTDLKPTIERLANGKEASYLGVTGVTVTREQTEAYGTPQGLYLTDVVVGSPAYNSGIQSGDVLVALNDVPVSFMKDVQSFLGIVEPGQEVEVLLFRQGKDEYVEQIYTVVIGAR
ncbi:MAG: PDZ domain-containing protein [Lachnospiraceae bacterium]|nr:PDZ domain-containing protein [Lachnospiraceae bacterium]